MLGDNRPWLENTQHVTAADVLDEVRAFGHRGVLPESGRAIVWIGISCVEYRHEHALRWLHEALTLHGRKALSVGRFYSSNDVPLLATWLANDPPVVELEFTVDRLTRDMAFALAKALKTNKTLARLRIKTLGDGKNQHARAFADVLRTGNHALCHLEVVKDNSDAESDSDVECDYDDKTEVQSDNDPHMEELCSLLKRNEALKARALAAFTISGTAPANGTSLPSEVGELILDSIVQMHSNASSRRTLEWLAWVGEAKAEAAEQLRAADPPRSHSASPPDANG
jgi:hypothetical protein